MASSVELNYRLNKYAFPSETQFADANWARHVYPKLVDRLLKNGTTAALYFGTLHLEANQILVDTCVDHGQRAFVGKVCMDQHAPDDYSETTEAALRDTEQLIHYVHAKGLPDDRLGAVVTPRFIPTCSPALLRGLGDLAHRYNVRVQSHISESVDEVEFVGQLYPGGETDADIFGEARLLERSVMAHGVHLSDQDVKTLTEHGASVSVCPLSNAYFAGGVFPIEKHHAAGLKTGLGTDVAGGYAPSMLTAIRHADLASRYAGHPLVDWVTALWTATVGGAQCLGIDHKVGTFEVGKDFDALLVDVAAPSSPVDVFSQEEPLERWIEKFIHLGDDRNILRVWVAGQVSVTSGSQ